MTPERVLAFDFGKRRIGIALGNTLTGTASPLDTISYHHPEIPWRAIDELVANWTPTRLLLGLPKLGDGSTSAMEAPIRAFARQLQKRYDTPVDFVDEAFTSREAAARLKQQRRQGRRQKVKKREIDRQAAAIIVEIWLENQGAT